MIPSYAVIPTRGRDTLRECVEAIESQVDAVILVDTGSPDYLRGYRDHEIVRDGGRRNISRWWNTGMDCVDKLAGDGPCWDVVVLNDDVVVPSGWVAVMSAEMRSTAASLAYPRMWHKITGYAFMLRGEDQLRADETMVWWYGDDDLEYQARKRGGVAVVQAPVDHRYPDVQTQSDPELVTQTHRDRATFEAKWGCPPW